MAVHYHGKLDRQALSLALLAVTLFGVTPVVIKLTSANPWAIGIVRLAIAASVFPFLAKFTREHWRLSLQHWPILLAMGVAFSLHWITYFFSIKWSSSGLASIGVASYGVHILWMTCLVTRKRPRALDFLSLALAIIGVVLVAPKNNVGPGMLPGFGLGLLSGLFWATLPLLNQRAVAIPTQVRSFPQYLVGLLLFLPFAGQADWSFGFKDWLLLIYLSLFSTLIAHTLWVKTSGMLPGSATAVMYYLHVPVALLLGWLCLGETIQIWQAVGIGFIAVGSWLGIRSSRAATETVPED